MLNKKEKIEFNPKFKKLLKKYPEISMLKLSWALYWRLALIILPVSILVSLITTILFPKES